MVLLKMVAVSDTLKTGRQLQLKKLLNAGAVATGKIGQPDFEYDY